MHSGADNAQSDTGKDVCVIALSRLVCLPVVFYFTKWRAGGEYASTLKKRSQIQRDDLKQAELSVQLYSRAI